MNLARVLETERKEIIQLWQNRNQGKDPKPKDGARPIDGYFGIAFSGGGIRSASVNLGIIQALAKAHLLEHVNYMSAISGGGYILGWLTAWIRRSNFHTVQQQLENSTAFPSEARQSRHADPDLYERFIEPYPIRRLREYSSFLTPRVGLTSGDTLAMISIYLRNVLLNQTLIICVAALLVALAQMTAPQIAWTNPLSTTWWALWGVVGLAAGIVAGCRGGRALNCLGRNQHPPEGKHCWIWTASLSLLMALSLWVLLPSAFIMGWKLGAFTAGIFAFTSLFAGWLADTCGGKEDLKAVDSRRWMVWIVWVSTLVVALGFLALLVWGFDKWLCHDGRVFVSDWYVMLGVPAILVALALTTYVYVGILGTVFPDAKREWLGRLAGYYLYFAAIIGLVMMGALRGPLWMHWLFQSVGATTRAGAWLKWLLPGGWLFTVIGGLLAAKSPKTGDAASAHNRALGYLARVAPPVFVAGVLLMVSWGVHAIAVGLSRGEYLSFAKAVKEQQDIGTLVIRTRDTGPSTVLYQAGSSETKQKMAVETRGVWYKRLPEPPSFWKVMKWPVPESTCRECYKRTLLTLDWQGCAPRIHLCWLAIVAFVALLIGALFVLRLDANEFSMHLFYRTRLVRAFLGASNLSDEQLDPESRVGSNAPSAKANQQQTNAGREASPFTGFALDDDIALQELCSRWPPPYKSDFKSCGELMEKTGEDTKEETGTQADDESAAQPLPGTKDKQEDRKQGFYDGPYPIWGTALNLTSGKEDLAWQKRKAASFIYSPLYCGWDYVNPREIAEPYEMPQPDTTCGSKITSAKSHDYCQHAYRGTGAFALSDPGGIDPKRDRREAYTGHGCGPYIGTAMAASGAAVSPNWGYHTRPAVAALLAFFNIRIGCWTGNPRREKYWKRYAPGAYYLLPEILGQTDDAGRYVYLSDGGHFENLGIYELVRRRMRFIIACDAGQDENYEFDDLANAVEKCRRDFGVEIKIDTAKVWKAKKSKYSKGHFAVGEITYPPPADKHADKSHTARTGYLLYIKSSLTGNESADVLGQRVHQPNFPHDPTVNQFFDETQFEVHRALGEHMLLHLWEKYKTHRAVLSRFVDPEKKAAKESLEAFFRFLKTVKDNELEP